MKLKRVLGFVLVLTLVLGTTFAYAETKVAYLDLGKIFDAYKKTKEYDQVLAEKEKSYGEEREKKITKVRGLQESLEVLSDAEKEEKKPELESEIKELQEFDRNQQEVLGKERNERVKEIFDDIKKNIAEYAQNNDYEIVFDSRALVYENKDLDITSEVLKILNQD
ncbi:MAG: OmpH family outer membrane protein [Candidatus Omnitrophica bacterium]|nr:OmpH family outer membrane protein [Candidatus Omnitrophota bacterium]